MAEAKRQPVNSKIATPKTTPTEAGSSSVEATLAKATGLRVKLTLQNPPATLEGTTFAVDNVLGVVALNTTPAPPNPSSSLAGQPADYRFLPLSRVQAVKVLNAADESKRGEELAAPVLSPADLRALKHKEQAAVSKLKEKLATRGVGVGEEGQRIFDHFYRSFPTRWQTTSIIVNDGVIIAKPYRLEDCSAPEHQQNQLPYIKKVLEDVRKRLLKSSPAREPKVNLPTLPRKGG